MDTQWSRFEVFEQEHPGQPHRNAGAVHAPDAELALLNARDVFVRRPDCHSLWVAPASQILTRTLEEIEAAERRADPPPAEGTPAQLYQVFQKQSQRQAETYVVHVGAVEARSAPEALDLARQRLGGRQAFVWWIVPEACLVRSTPGEAASLFAPARDKPYRQPSFYRVLTQMRAVRSGETGAAPGETEA